jgi:hypothetical protein
MASDWRFDNDERGTFRVRRFGGPAWRAAGVSLMCRRSSRPGLPTIAAGQSWPTALQCMAQFKDMSYLSDTQPGIARKQIELLRQAGSRRRLAIGLRMGEDAIQLSRHELRRLHPTLTDQQIALLWVKVHYGDDMAEQLRAYLKLQHD